MDARRGCRRPRRGLERDQLEWDAVDLRDLLDCEVVVLRTTEASADDLLAQQLRFERSQPNDVCDRRGVPALGQHRDGHDAAHVATRWNRRIDARATVLD